MLKNALDTQFGFPGFVTSDWGGTHSTVAAANAGLDQQMPDDSFFGAALSTAVSNGQVSQATLNGSCESQPTARPSMPSSIPVPIRPAEDSRR